MAVSAGRVERVAATGEHLTTRPPPEAASEEPKRKEHRERNGYGNRTQNVKGRIPHGQICMANNHDD